MAENLSRAVFSYSTRVQYNTYSDLGTTMHVLTKRKDKEFFNVKTGKKQKQSQFVKLESIVQKIHGVV